MKNRYNVPYRNVIEINKMAADVLKGRMHCKKLRSLGRKQIYEAFCEMELR